MKDMKVLNLYAGLGGNRKKWQNCHVTAVELEPKIAAVYQAQFPNDTVIVSDAHQYLKDHFREFDFIWSSPPCQKHSKMMKATRHDVADYIDLKLYQEIIFLQHFFKGKWVVENVVPYYKPLILPTQRIGRHLFWSNFDFMAYVVPNKKGFIKNDNLASVQAMKDWLGIQYDGNIYYGENHSPGQVLRNCVHPDLGLHIFNSIPT